MEYLVMYGEIAVKSPSVRRHMELLLARNLKEQSGGQVKRLEGRLLVTDPKVPGAIGKTFGVERWTRTLHVDSHDPEDVFTEVKDALDDLKARSFAVRTRRATSDALSSREMNVELGDLIRRHTGWTVDLDEPDVEIHVELRPEGTFVYLDSWVKDGPGGLPYGSQSRVVCLVSGGIDSPVAAWYAARRGCEVIWLHLDRGKYGSEVDAVERLAEMFSEWLPSDVELLIEDFEDFMEKLEGLEGESARYRCVLCKREMIRRACDVCENVGAVAVVMGDVVGQVASQIPDNLSVIDRVARFPVFRPLLGFDKNEVQRLSERLGFFEVSKEHRPCPLAPRNPVKSADPGKVLKLEEGLGVLHRGLRGSGVAGSEEYR
ncbi:tRNA sulfurtransferase [Methanopyrus sp. SNP6]|uniref:tRNA sulfurtransferase n=1 Tax=Methanopyrus sp. SNP6 TaxID=1937005 RepID=UPI0011E5A36E|nr:tRNA sulfurtransferase [Methanopyrus sp. SNP6]